ncbi:MAG: Fic family protein [Candidatus Diapherotrites archaeon]|nr:Fic family protein [Candidatus Diapherotrites archaeon]
MVFVEKRKEGTSTLYYLTKSFREKGRVKKKRVFLGTNLTPEQVRTLSDDANKILGEISFDSVLSPKEIVEFEELRHSLNEKISTFEKDNFYEHFITEFTYDSNAIEGSSLTLAETSHLLFKGITPKNKPMKHLIEAKNHKEAYDFVSSLKQKKLSTPILCKIQKIVVKDTLPSHLEGQDGRLRTVNVKVGQHIAPPFFVVQRKLKTLIKWFNLNMNKHHPIVVAAYFHSEFESLHPFAEGNGRTGRLLMNFMLTRHGYPPITIFLKHRFDYYLALEKARNEKNLKPLIKIMRECYKEMEKTYTA